MNLLRVLAVVVALVASACQTTGMSFTRDKRIVVTSPRPRDVLTLPVSVRWRVSEELRDIIRSSDGEKYFAVFVDRAPIRGGNDISDVVSSECRRTAGCGDEQWFKDRGIYFTSRTRIMIDDVDDLRHDRSRENRDLHRATIVVMRRAEERDLETVVDGTRDGEGAVSVDFWVDRSAS